MISFKEFLEQALCYEPYRRRGQAIHNLLAMERKDLWWRMIAIKSIDPYSDDARIEACLDWLEVNW